MSLCLSNTTGKQKLVCDKTNYFWVNLSFVEPRVPSEHCLPRKVCVRLFLACPLSWQQCLSFSSRIFKDRGFFVCLFAVWRGKRSRGMKVYRDLIWKTDLTVFWKLSNFFSPRVKLFLRAVRSCSHVHAHFRSLHSELLCEDIQKRHFQCLRVDGRVFFWLVFFDW